MTEKQIEHIVKVKEMFMKKYQDWREGQSLFNAILAVNPEMGEKIRGSKIDPFYQNSKINACMKFLREEKLE